MPEAEPTEPTEEPGFAEAVSGAPAAIPEPTPAPPDVRQQFADLGYDVSGFDDDKTFMAAVGDSLKEYHNSEPLIKLGRQFAPHASQFSEYLEAQKAPQTPPAEVAPQVSEEPPPFEWKVPQVNNEHLRVLSRNAESGLWEAPPGLEVQLGAVVQQANDAEMAQQSQAQRLLREFPDLVNQVSGPQISKVEKALAERLEKLEEAWQQAQVQQEMRAYVDQRADDLFQKDGNGQFVIDRETGSRTLTPMGQALSENAAKLSEMGIDDPETIRLLADRLTRLQQLEGQFSDSTPKGDGAQKKQLFLDTHKRDQGEGAAPPVASDQAAPDTPRKFFSTEKEAERISRELMQEAGISPD